MGIILCKIHGRSNIAQMSHSLYRNYTIGKSIKIIKITFKVDNLGSFIHFFSDLDNLNYMKIKSIEDFEDFFLSISSDQVCCSSCFNLYINEKNIQVTEKLIEIN